VTNEGLVRRRICFRTDGTPIGKLFHIQPPADLGPGVVDPELVTPTSKRPDPLADALRRSDNWRQVVPALPTSASD